MSLGDAPRTPIHVFIRGFGTQTRAAPLCENEDGQHFKNKDTQLNMYLSWVWETAGVYAASRLTHWHWYKDINLFLIVK